MFPVQEQVSCDPNLQSGVPLLEGLTPLHPGLHPGIDGGDGYCRTGLAQEVVLFTIASSCQPVLLIICVYWEVLQVMS